MRLTTSQTRLLVISDTRGFLETMTTYLHRHGFTLFTASSDQEGLNLAQQTQPDLILLDLVNSAFKDLETCQRLKQNPHTHKIPIIVLTEMNNMIEQVKAFAASGTDYLLKPIQEPELIARIIIRLREHECLAQLQHRLASYERRYGLLKSEISFSTAQSISARGLNDIYRVQQYLLEHLDASHSLTALAHLAHTNRNKLNRSFQTLFGLSVFDWLREQRLQKAAELLRTTSHSIQDISLCVGYGNHAHFTTQFKQRFQVTPKQYRNQAFE